MADRTERSSRCRRVSARLPAYVEQELQGEELLGMRAHLDGCRSCREDAARLKRALAPLRRVEHRQAPSEVTTGLYARIADMERRRSRPLRLVRYAGAFASLLLVLASAAVVSRWGLPPAKPTETRLSRVVPGAISPVLPTDSGPASIEMRQAAVPIPPQAAAPEGGADASVGAPAPAGRPQRERAGTKKVAPSPSGFLDVADSKGVTARALMAERAASLPTAPSAKHDAVARRAVVRPERVEEMLNERVRVGRNVTTLRGETVWDDAGNMTAIRVKAETTEDAEFDDAPSPER